MGTQYEYHVIAYRTREEVEAELNRLALEDWELVGEVVHDCHPEGGLSTIAGEAHTECWVATLKRRII